MGEYRGLARIAARLGRKSWRAGQRLILDKGLLAYKQRIGPREYWVTNDELIRIWLLARCKADAERARERRETSRARKIVDPWREP